MSTILHVTLPGSNGPLQIHEFADVSDSATGRVMTGSWTWDSAFVLAYFLSTESTRGYPLHGKTVLELGAGTGLPGLTAARLGASRVVLTDVAPLVPGLRMNAEVNGLVDRVEACELVWGSDELPSGLGGGSVDLVLMSDVFYDPTEMTALARTLKTVCGDETRVWAASEVRASTGECLDELASHGFEAREVLSRTRLRGELDLETFAVYELKKRPFDTAFSGERDEQDASGKSALLGILQFFGPFHSS